MSGMAARRRCALQASQVITLEGNRDYEILAA
jgi:hypothetical protein